MIYFSLFMVALSVVVLLDSQRRYGKASVLMAGFLPITMGLTGLLYLFFRHYKKAGPEAPYPLKADWRIAVSAVLFSFFSYAFVGGEKMRITEEAEKVQAQKQRLEQAKQIAKIKDPYERAMARKQAGMPYLNVLKEVPKNHPKFAAVQPELQTLLVAQAKERALAEKQAKLARAAQAKQAAAEREQRIGSMFSRIDGSHSGLARYIKKSMNDPSSYEHVETKYWDRGDHLVVATTFRGKNAFGGLVLNTLRAKVNLDGQVLAIME